MTKQFKIIKIDHVAVAVNDLNSSQVIFSLLGMNFGVTEYVENEQVNTLKIHPENQEHTIELLEGLKDSSVEKFIENKGQGLHHIALEVDNIENAINYLKSNQINLIYQKPRKGAGNKLITFIHPKSTPGILIELCQSI